MAIPSSASVGPSMRRNIPLVDAVQHASKTTLTSVSNGLIRDTETELQHEGAAFLEDESF